MNLFAQYKDAPDLPGADFEFHLRRLRPVIDALANQDSMLKDWYIQGGAEEAMKCRVYGDDHQPSPGAVDEMIKEYKGKSRDDPKSIGIWNGATQKYGASFMISLDGGYNPSQNIDFNAKETSISSSRLGDFRSVAQIIEKVVEMYAPSYAIYGPRKYFQESVFNDRPGVSWMLYLPYVLTSNQVPEARALIPITRDGGQQGTIIVSVTDEVFNVNDRAHVKVANDIEIRLANQDLLPRFIDL
ncbi:Imm52 family immunity protein [Paraburkholderia bannensis]|uniref:Imm52 family immunity protein n=1 Tax=Paraburkholderia bannensis TaxID=765414 RepID=UPI002AB5F2F2|nr:Imm52 family immunity protein [Paraburkholderia bannensis]